jgi:hypothetical protein
MLLSQPPITPPTPVPPNGITGGGTAATPSFIGPYQVWWGETDNFYSGVGGTLWYRHGSSAFCNLGAGTPQTNGPGSTWNVKILPGRDQWFTLRLAGVVVARIHYRNVQSYAANF